MGNISCDRNLCFQNYYNNIGCDECEVTKLNEESSEDKEKSMSDISCDSYDESVYVVTYRDEDTNEVTVCAFSNESAASACYRSFSKSHSNVTCDEVPLYSRFFDGESWHRN